MSAAASAKNRNVLTADVRSSRFQPLLKLEVWCHCVIKVLPGSKEQKQKPFGIFPFPFNFLLLENLYPGNVQA